jgi:hypothetical protein
MSEGIEGMKANINQVTSPGNDNEWDKNVLKVMMK